MIVCKKKKKKKKLLRKKKLKNIGWGCRINRQYLCSEVKRPSHNECPGYDTKQSDGEAPVMLEL